jgi:DNA mismatch repair protein MutS
VPAESASIGIVDRIFTRVGASDNLAGGESTFLVEMLETANILNSATEKSLVIMDEVGRGTSTYDGLAIAWAVVEYLADRRRVGSRTLFATHYHELAVLAERTGIRNFNVAVKEWNNEVIFLRRVVPGAADQSYGIHVARLAGIPEAVILRAREILHTLEEKGVAEVRQITHEKTAQLELFAPPAAPALSTAERDALERLRSADPNALTPMDALALLADLRAKLDSSSPSPPAGGRGAG